jgi:hypothetical protein
MRNDAVDKYVTAFRILGPCTGIGMNNAATPLSFVQGLPYGG